MIRPRAEVIATPPAVHGGPAGRADERHPIRLDFSASLNAYGPAPIVLEAVRAAPIDRYPDPESLAPRRAAAQAWARDVDEIAFGAGASELLQSVCLAYLRPGDAVLVPAPTYGEYTRAARLCGARVFEETAPAPDFTVDADAMVAAVHRHRPRMTFLCAPNNPTGQRLDREDLRRVADACTATDALLVIDQSYDAFLRDPLGTPALPGHTAALHLRSLTKCHALAGVRVAFAIGPVDVIAALERTRVPWAASAAAQAAAVAALSAEGERHLADTLPCLRAGREMLDAEFARLSMSVVRSDAHFAMADVGDAARLAARLCDAHGIRVRDCVSFGLPRHIRVAARTSPENEALAAALEAECSS